MQDYHILIASAKLIYFYEITKHFLSLWDYHNRFYPINETKSRDTCRGKTSITAFIILLYSMFTY